MWRYVNTDELYHYGVKGMKWGHRKNSSSDKRSDNKSESSKGKSTALKIVAGIGVAALATVAVGAAVKYGKTATNRIVNSIGSKPIKDIEYIPSKVEQRAGMARWARYQGRKDIRLNIPNL